MAVTDSNGEVIKEYAYSPYGELLLGEHDGRILFLYNGQYGVTTDDNGLYYMRARYYNVDIKRFVNQDVLTGTLERISSLNRYAYVEGNPVSFLDPFGLAKSIYDDWHEILQIAEDVYVQISLFVTVLSYGIPFFREIIGPVVWVESFIVYCFDFGVAIGRAWEGVFENDYKKIDTSYDMMKETTSSMIMMLETLTLDSLNEEGITVYGFISDLISALGQLADKL